MIMNNEYCACITSELSDNNTMCNRYKLLENVINGFQNQGYNINHIAEINIITISNKLEMSYEFYITHIMCALEWKSNAMLKK